MNVGVRDESMKDFAAERDLIRLEREVFAFYPGSVDHCHFFGCHSYCVWRQDALKNLKTQEETEGTLRDRRVGSELAAILVGLPSYAILFQDASCTISICRIAFIIAFCVHCQFIGNAWLVSKS